MDTQVVIDSGVFLATLLPNEGHSQKAEVFLEYVQEQNLKVFAPVLFQYEVVSIMRKSVAFKRLHYEKSVEYRDILLALDIEYVYDVALSRRAYDIATELNRPSAYDSQYLAVAERLGCDFWTADEKLYNAVKGKLLWVKWIAAYHPPA